MKTIKNKLSSVKYFSILLLLVFFVGLPSSLFAEGNGEDESSEEIELVDIYSQEELKTLENPLYWRDFESLKSNVVVLSNHELDAYEMEVREGIIYVGGSVFNSTSNDGTIYVMDEYGVIYIKDIHNLDKFFFHASFLNGDPVAGAGEMIINNGKLVSINTASGHYRPKLSHLELVVAKLMDMGINFENAVIKKDGDYFKVDL